ncbi:hypothetical protein LH464_23290 [Neorhizobium sp. T786]|uniref:hypothetical protein n=1 Tax=Pseudorhizobium xiangyangii TaxID=2883104 RepID=UPI001CFF8AD3|nr:hypothetical protein [Neorhizobium xiangyangii]MCB5205389.1 hypothetical protein [Neorhizobium xiangyangii]
MLDRLRTTVVRVFGLNARTKQVYLELIGCSNMSSLNAKVAGMLESIISSASA